MRTLLSRSFTSVARGLAVLALVVTFAVPASASAQTANGCAPGQAPGYVFGFADLQSRLTVAMGDPMSCEFPDPNGTGDVHQRTTRGLAFWRKATNTPTFTNGSEHWAITVRGLLYWTGSSIDPPPSAVVVPPNECSGCGTAGPGPVTPGSVPDRDDLPLGGPTSFLFPVVDGPADTLTFTCLTENPSCGRDVWWAERNEIGTGDLRQFSFLAPNFLSEHRFVEAVWLLWQWPEGKALLQDAAGFGVGIAAGLNGDRDNFAAFDESTRTIWVSSRYADSATWLVADVLAHELTHASDAAGRRLGRTPSGCIAAEQRAFHAEQRFLTYVRERFGGLPSSRQVSRLPSADRAM
jgi:hypothetical protein